MINENPKNDNKCILYSLCLQTKNGNKNENKNKFRVVVRNLSTRGGSNIFFLSRGGLSTRWGLKPPEIHRFHWSRGGLAPIAPPLTTPLNMVELQPILKRQLSWSEENLQIFICITGFLFGLEYLFVFVQISAQFSSTLLYLYFLHFSGFCKQNCTKTIILLEFRRNYK